MDLSKNLKRLSACPYCLTSFAATGLFGTTLHLFACPERKITCPKCASFVKVKVEAKHSDSNGLFALKQHLTTECSFETTCYHCEKKLPANQYPAHHKELCGPHSQRKEKILALVGKLNQPEKDGETIVKILENVEKLVSPDSTPASSLLRNSFDVSLEYLAQQIHHLHQTAPLYQHQRIFETLYGPITHFDQDRDFP